MPRYRRVAAPTAHITDLRVVKDAPAEAPAEDVTVVPDEVVLVIEEVDEAPPDPPKRKRGRPRKNPVPTDD